MSNRLLGYYGDDFTGSTDVLESLFRQGLRTVLFLEPPSEEMLEERFGDVTCYGIAGVGRSMSPEEMERELRPIFETMRQSGVLIAHYKLCSTFDSSPETGSIGRAVEIGRRVFGAAAGGSYVPLIVGVPYLRRYTLFGHHYAAAEEQVYRLDRHPTMSRHPVTPMDESDLLRHLSRQSSMRASLFNIVDLEGPIEQVQARLEQLLALEQPELVLFDVLDDARLDMAGRLIWQAALQRAGLFVAGSSGVEYALAASMAAHLQARDDDVRQSPVAPPWGNVDRLLVVSGSCSPMTERQIACALAAGYAGIKVPVADLIRPEARELAIAALREEALAALQLGRSVILYSAAGPHDETVAQGRAALIALGLRPEDSSRLLGAALGALARQLIAATGLSRLAIAGGDTSGYVTRELGIYALECRAALEPGVPLCRAYANDPRFDGLELVLKGGQVGGENFFERTRAGETVTDLKESIRETSR